MKRVSIRLALAALLASIPGAASANPEPSLYDSRSVGLAGTGVAYGDNPASIYTNPAGLQHIRRFALSASFASITADISAPVGGPDEVLHTGYTTFPSGLLALAYRVHDRVVIAAGGYAQTGYGASYDDVTRINETDLFFAEDQSVLLFVVEGALAASVRLHDKIDAGISARFPYARLRASLTQEIFEDDWRLVDQTVSGAELVPGILAGITIRATDTLTLGAAYRSKIVIDMEGTTGIHFTQAGPLEIDTKTKWTVPHMVRFGGALELMRRKLMLTSELRIQLHRKANKSQIFQTDFMGFEEIEAPYDWKNVYSLMFAGEYRRRGMQWPVRLGVSGSNSATPRKSVQFFTPPPGLLLALYAGTGFSRPSYGVDFGLSVQWGGDDVPDQPGRCQPGERVKVGCAGAYGVRSVFVTASYTFRR